MAAVAALALLAFPAIAQERGSVGLKADRIAVDNVTQAAVATGHVEAVAGVVTLRGDYAERMADGTIHFHDTTYVTTCTNEVGHTHWNLTGEVEFKENEYVTLRNCWLRFYEFPIVWLPYLNYPLDTDCGFAWMPGYTDEWGAYLMTKSSYHLLGDRGHGDDAWWLKGATRFDMRWEQGFALGEDLNWSLDGLGKGYFKVYYAWDQSDMYENNGMRDDDYNYHNWGSSVPSERYALEFGHRWDATERDSIRVKGSYFSDSYFRDDFFRDSLFNIANPFLSYEGNELAWEHRENTFGGGLSVSGPLNDFVGGTKRLPELYFDIAPQPIFDLPINYESDNRMGYLGRQGAEFGNGNPNNPYANRPGVWADYDTFRFDTYHRLTAPFRLFDVVSAVPRVGYRGTYWNACGGTDVYGWGNVQGDCGGQLYRSIIESGVTFAGRGTAWINDDWQHMLEPYADVLAQEACFSGAKGGKRPYVFDSLDASRMWEEQFAGRGRNLPYSYYGVTPGFRNAWNKLEENGNLRTIVDLDLYAALQFNQTDWYEQDAQYGYYGSRDLHKLATPGDPNYGDNGCTIVPGARVRWLPDDDITLMANVEYNAEDTRVALADAGFQQKVSQKFKYYAKYALRDARYWDYSSTPYLNNDSVRMESDDLNRAYYHMADVGFEQQPISWLAWSPFLRWDLKEAEMDCVGTWVDLLTDCLGFRFIVSYKNSYTTIDGYERKEHWNFGFMIYLRALGTNGADIFNN